MFRKFLLMKCAAILGALFFGNIAQISTAEASPYVFCKTKAGPTACHTSRHIAHLRARQTCPHILSPYGHTVSRNISCTRRYVHGRIIWCCRCIVRICKRPIIRQPIPRRPLWLDPGPKKEHFRGDRLHRRQMERKLR